MSNALALGAGPILDPAYRLEDRYARESGRVFMTGTQALVRAVLDQAARDRASGLDTAGYVSGYRGSPLGAVDMELWRARKILAERRITFQPGVNEDLAATAILGTQQVESDPNRTVQGVFGLWYGKGPGVDRSATRSSTATPTAPRRMAGCWSWRATTMAASPPPCRTSPTSPSWRGSCRR